MERTKIGNGFSKRRLINTWAIRAGGGISSVISRIFDHNRWIEACPLGSCRKNCREFDIVARVYPGFPLFNDSRWGENPLLSFVLLFAVGGCNYRLCRLPIQLGFSFVGQIKRGG